jgi:hypothetical protein
VYEEYGVGMILIGIYLFIGFFVAAFLIGVLLATIDAFTGH